MRVIVGCDPDSSRNGFAVYRNGVLCELLNLNAIEFYLWLVANEKVAIKNKEILISLENPKGNSSSSFHHSRYDSPAVKAKKSEGVGRVKQAQTAVEQVAQQLGIPVALHKNSSQWKKGSSKELFKKITGWQARSNEETRSAAYMGYLEVKR